MGTARTPFVQWHQLLATLCAAISFGPFAHATVTAITIPDAAATEGMIGEYAHPPMDKAHQLAGKALVDALRRGGYVLFMRHAETGTVTAECSTSNLTPRGERDAARVGFALKALAVPLDRIISSPVCRVQDTARNLGLGPFEVSEDLANQALRPGFDFNNAREKLLVMPPSTGKNVLLISHTQGGNNFSQALALDFGEIIVIAPDGKGGRAAIARVRVDDWAGLKAAAGQSK
jgi:phosphohistidine phosphatase SixA